jgi:hypothetical protein
MNNMARKKKKQEQNLLPDGVFLPDMVIGETQIGTPTMAFFPARNYHFKVIKNKHTVTIPRSGDYHKLAPDVFPKNEGSFMLYDEENSVMYLPAISKVLFAVEKYPDLKSNQLFMPIVLMFNEDTVDVIGQVIEMLPPLTTTSTVA